MSFSVYTNYLSVYTKKVENFSEILFNVKIAIFYSDYVSLKELLSRDFMNELIHTETFDIMMEKMLKKARLEVLRCFYPYIHHFQEIMDKRLKFLENENSCHLCLDGIVYDKYNNRILDKLTSVEDILEDYSFFRTYTGIELSDSDFLDKIKEFLGNNMEFEDIGYFLSLRDETVY